MKYNTYKPQQEKNWAGELKTIIYLGRCVVCNRTVYGYEDEHAPDPRGLIAYTHTYHPLNSGDYGMTGESVPMCYACMDEKEAYIRGLELAMRQWISINQ